MDKIKIAKRRCKDSELSVKEAILYLFAGCFDSNKRYSIQIYKTQADVAAAIAEATDNSLTPNQSAVSKQISKLCDSLCELNKETFVIHKTPDGYKRMKTSDAFEMSCTQLLESFDATDIFFNDIITPTEYIFKLRYPSELKNAKRQLESIFEGCLFRIATSKKEKTIESKVSNAEDTPSREKAGSILISVRLCPLSDTFSAKTKSFHDFLAQYYKDIKS